MSQPIRARVTGTGMCVPPRVVTNRDLEALMDTTDEWIQQRSGIKERRHVDEGTTPSDLAAAACEMALARAGRAATEVDLLITATLSPEHYFPGTASFVQRKLGMGSAPALDVRNQCSGFLYGLEVARSMIETGRYRRVLLCGVEVHSRALDMTTRGRDVAVLFGDGAGAVLLESEKDPERGVLWTALHADGRHAEKLWVQYPTLASAPHISPALVEEGGVYPKMDGKHVFKHAVQYLPEVIHESLAPLHLRPADVDLWLFHQANLRINEHVATLLGIPAAKCPSNIERYGNCSAASIPMLLHECVEAGRVKAGDLVAMAGFGSGFTWGSAVLRW
jgi:3-oxoacyl-[acyl-carrier-protein] synthase-3